MKLTVIKPLVVALAGNPNCGKTTLFNALTGLRQKVANYPGVTVEKKVGKCTLESGQTIDVIDLPGAYSLISKSPDEMVTMQVLRGLRFDTPAPDVVVCVVDASNLQRNLYLLSQLIELGRPMVVALNMMDIAERRGLNVSPEKLSKQLGVPVIPVVGHKSQGIDELKRAIIRATAAPMPDFALGDAMHTELKSVAGELSSVYAGKADEDRPFLSPRAMAERLLIGDHAPDVVELLKNDRIKSVVDQSHSRLSQMGIDPMQADIEAHYLWIDQVAAAAAGNRVKDAGGSESSSAATPHTLHPVPYAPALTLTEKLDHVFLHKIWGLVTFAGIMAALFVGIFIVADPLMGATESLVSWVGGFVTARLPAEGALHDLWVDGIVAGVGGVLVFVPQIAVLFLFLAIMEDSGYLARAAFLMDRILGKLGLNGKSFIPLLSSFACAIPGIMATRTIESRKDRLITIFVAPFMSCSARLPVYGLLIGAFFASFSPFVRGGIMFACYALGVLAAVITALIFRKTFMKSAPTSFVLELPTYKMPQPIQVVRVMFNNTWAFVRKAGTVIFALSVILWAMSYYPRMPEAGRAAVIKDTRVRFWDKLTEEFATGPVDSATRESMRQQLEKQYSEEGPKLLDVKNRELDAAQEQAVAAAQLEYSISGRIGHAIEPVLKPLGYDWKMGVGLVAAFAAREVFVSQMAIVYSAGDVEDDQSTLADAMKNDRDSSGKPVWTVPVAISLLVWFVLAMQCMSTVAIVRRETGGWSWAIGQLVYMNAVAYLAAMIVYQVCSRIFA